MIETFRDKDYKKTYELSIFSELYVNAMMSITNNFRFLQWTLKKI